MGQCHIMVTRHSAFYTPLLVTIGGGYLAAEGIDAKLVDLGVLPRSTTLAIASQAGRLPGFLSTGCPIRSRPLKTPNAPFRGARRAYLKREGREYWLRQIP